MLQDAFAGRLAQENVTVAEYPATGVMESVYDADCPDVTVLLVLPPVWVPTDRGL